jgi:hypothetical protein
MVCWCAGARCAIMNMIRMWYNNALEYLTKIIVKIFAQFKYYLYLCSIIRE